MSARVARRRARPRRLRYDGRSYGTPAAAPIERKPGRQAEAAETALRDVMELFADPERLPAAIAETVIARQAGTSPMVNWSLPNQLLCILSGSVDCRGIRQWNDAGRKVKKGARCVRILAPRTRRITERDAATGEESARTIVSGFLGIPVFRFEDTEGAPLEIPDYQPAAMPPLFEVAERLGVSISWAPFVAKFKGYYRPGTDSIVLCSHDARTFLHELAHAAHERVLQARSESLQGGQVASQEVVAEVVAATLCRLYDLSGFLPHSREYVDHYAGNGGPAKAALRVLGDVQAVLLLLLEGEEPESASERQRARELVAA